MLSLGLMKLKLLLSIASVHPSGMYSIPVSRFLICDRWKKQYSDGISRNFSGWRLAKAGFFLQYRGRSRRQMSNVKRRRCKRTKRTLLPEQLGIPREGNAPFLIPALSPFFHDGRFVSWREAHGNSSVCISRHRHRLIGRYITSGIRNLCSRGLSIPLRPSSMHRTSLGIMLDEPPFDLYVNCQHFHINGKYQLIARARCII